MYSKGSLVLSLFKTLKKLGRHCTRHIIGHRFFLKIALKKYSPEFRISTKFFFVNHPVRTITVYIFDFVNDK